MRWRQKLRAIHRDLGYAACALTLAYALSGLAVNHIEDWNPNYTTHEIPIDLSEDDHLAILTGGDLNAMEAHLVSALAIPPQTVRGRFMASERLFRVYLDDGEEIRVDVHTGKGSIKRIETRAVVYELNALHLNNLKGIWTWVADAFAVALVVLALTGLFLNKGKAGLAGRGKWFLAAGLAVPLLFVFYLYA
ncbi:MAG: hypothetical protein Tsb0020_01790 [Haliangiales bacterium]